MKLPVRYFGHPDLRKKAQVVEKITPEIIKIAEDMVETMVSMENAIGFAGPQLGVPLRIFVIREEKCVADDEYVFAEPEVIINPVLSNPSKEIITMVEGCMSLPALQVDVDRPDTIHVKYQNLKGEYKEEALEGFRARMFMHENDHINGVLIIDRIDSKQRRAVEPLLKKIKSKYN